jgi:hypothetical protein
MLRCFRVVILFLLFPLISLASGGFETNWPNSPLGTELNSGAQIHELIAYIYEWGISLGGIAVFAILIIAGLEYIGSAGDPAKMALTLKRIENGILGLILLLTSWLVLDTINPQLTTIQALPNLWENNNYSSLSVGSMNSRGVPCDYVVVWDEEDYKGNKSVVSFGEDETIKIFNGKNSIKSIADPWGSVKGYRKLSENEKETVIGDRYDANGNLSDNGDYVLGGVCQLKLYHYSDSWFGSDCGMLMGSTMVVEVPNVNAIKQSIEEEQEDEEVGCIHIVRFGVSGGDELAIYDDGEGGSEEEEEEEEEDDCRAGEYRDISGNCVCLEGWAWCRCANACIPAQYVVPAGESCPVIPSCPSGQFYLLGANRCVICPPDCYWCSCLDAVVQSEDDCVCD